MSYLVTMKVPGDLGVFTKALVERADEFRAVADKARAAGALHHRFGLGDGYVHVIDEWEAINEFEAFFNEPTMQAFIGSVFFLPLAAVGSGVPPAPSGQGLFALVYLGSVVTVGAYDLYNFGVSRLPASQATGFINLIPVFTLVFAWLLLGERLNGQQLLAAGLVFAGVALSQWRSATPAPAGVLD